MDKEHLLKMKMALGNLTDSIDDLISISDREDEGEAIPDKEIQQVMGKFMIALMEMESIK